MSGTPKLISLLNLDEAQGQYPTPDANHFWVSTSFMFFLEPRPPFTVITLAKILHTSQGLDQVIGLRSTFHPPISINL